ncbi:MAG: hypothetical protein HXX18_09765 [Bacteroidetes bacterium]|nr:hypothetical protein [Bacteroidota bacterium]
MNDNYILIETRLFENGRMRIKRKLNATGEWDEQTFSTELNKKQEAKEEPFTFKNKTIISFQKGSYCIKDKYDALGRVVIMKVYEHNKLTNYTEFKYNSPYTKTKCDQYVSYECPRKIQYSKKISYNPNGEIIQETCFYPKGEIAWYANRNYNKQGQLTEVSTYNNMDILIYKKIDTYNNGEIIKKEKFIHKDFFHKWEPGNGGNLDFCLDTNR